MHRAIGMAASGPRVSPETARALVGGSLVDSGDRRCPVYEKPLGPRQRAFAQVRCRAGLSRQRQERARQTRQTREGHSVHILA